MSRSAAAVFGSEMLVRPSIASIRCFRSPNLSSLVFLRSLTLSSIARGRQLVDLFRQGGFLFLRGKEVRFVLLANARGRCREGRIDGGLNISGGFDRLLVE